jgi:hypothetical protein
MFGVHHKKYLRFNRGYQTLVYAKVVNVVSEVRNLGLLANKKANSF